MMDFIISYIVNFATGYNVVSVSYVNGKDVDVCTGILDVRIVPNLNIAVGDIVYGDDLIINVNVASGATGNVTVTMGNNGSFVSNYTLSLEEAKLCCFGCFKTR